MNVPGGGIVGGDYDNDGDLDYFYPAGELVGGTGTRNLLLRNDRGRLIDVTEDAGLTDIRISAMAIWLDFDRDGFLDLYVGHWTFLEGFDDLYNILYRNQGNGTFVDVTDQVGLPTEGEGSALGVLAQDVDDNGWPDIYLPTSGPVPPTLFLNAEGSFVHAPSQGFDLAVDNWGVAAGDIDNDGDLDLFQPAVSNTSAVAGEHSLPQRSALYLNLGDGAFLDATEGVGLTVMNGANVFFAHFLDFDNDGDLDLLPVAECHPYSRIRVSASSLNALSNPAFRVAMRGSISMGMDFSISGLVQPSIRTGVMQTTSCASIWWEPTATGTE